MRRTALAACLVLLAGSAQAAGPGCDKLHWNLDAERALIAAASRDGVAGSPPVARRLVARPTADAGLPKLPERSPRTASALAGHFTVLIPEAGIYRITLDTEGWLDVIQNDAYRRADVSTRAHDCPGIRKSVRFRLEPGPAIIQVSDGSAAEIGVAVTREP